ncbi:MAG: rRNA maturation RNase YbeY [Patescibacteria group bacterium]|jgi:probable rRNA maturation factor
MNLINRTKSKINKDFFEKIAKDTFSYLNEKSNYDFDVVLVSDDEIKNLNKKYRKIDKVTDVLTFNIKEENFLGQIFICIDQVKRQAKKIERNDKEELAEIFIHGILHLFDYNDENEKGYKKMVFLQKEILFRLRKILDKFYS